jgi:hypothetical protein
MDHTLQCPCSWYVIQFHDRVVHVLEEFMLEAGATRGRDLRLEVCRNVRELIEIDIWGSSVVGLHDPTPSYVLDVTAPAGGAAEAVPEGDATAGPSARTSNSMRWALVTM